ncbi:hypothetical protein [Kingella sp. (in: b-proteobacteria)]|uniref:hypothetical protein n=1 Tax=Kingella sp. (in: b-proteobacteria) TaxID=2020713 RepID=UPI0026DB7393|nr:hypothetical protein [Kingella sp. (in: b-proteobacteria)]MDO4657969.1 hypothetical protein [Kingella sp. (in: b-proteobacteria)]
MGSLKRSIGSTVPRQPETHSSEAKMEHRQLADIFAQSYSHAILMQPEISPRLAKT